jgi:hypothetical protein
MLKLVFVSSVLIWLSVLAAAGLTWVAFGGPSC